LRIPKLVLGFSVSKTAPQSAAERKSRHGCRDRRTTGAAAAQPLHQGLRRERIFTKLGLGWTYRAIAGEERLSERRVYQIVSDALERQGVDTVTDHALIQLVRLENAQATAARAIAAGDLRAIAPYPDVLDRLDRHQKAVAAREVYDDAAREKPFAKMNRVAARLQAEKARKAAKRAAADPPAWAAEPSSAA